MIQKVLQFKLNKDGFIDEFMLPGGEAILPEGISLELADDFDIEDFKQHYAAYQFKNNKLERNEEQLPLVIKERNDNELRLTRQRECFSVINRGSLWYDFLTFEQKEELREWYQAWLEVTDTNEIPQKPLWLD